MMLNSVSGEFQIPHSIAKWWICVPDNVVFVMKYVYSATMRQMCLQQCVQILAHNLNPFSYFCADHSPVDTVVAPVGHTVPHLALHTPQPQAVLRCHGPSVGDCAQATQRQIAGRKKGERP